MRRSGKSIAGLIAATLGIGLAAPGAQAAPPVLSGIDGATIEYTENGPPVLLDPDQDATVTDADTSSFPGAIFNVSASGAPGAAIGISDNDAVSVLFDEIRVDGVLIGTWDSFSAPADPTIVLNGSATPARLTKLVRRFTFSSSSDFPGGPTRSTIDYRLDTRTGEPDSVNDITRVRVDVTAVNDAPTVVAPATVAVDAGVATPLTGISFGDVDAGEHSVTATLSVPLGRLDAPAGAGVAVLGSGTGSIELTGSIPDLNGFIAAGNVTFTSAAGSIDDVTLTAGIDDRGWSGTGGALSDTATTTLDVAPVLDLVAPTEPIRMAQGTTHPFSDATGSPIRIGGVFDPDSPAQLSLTIPAGFGGELLLSDGTAEVIIRDGSATFDRPIADINDSLDTLRFAASPTFTGRTTFTVTLREAGSAGGALIEERVVALDVVPPPVVASVAVPDDGLYASGDVLDFTVTFDDPVVVDTSGGSPVLALSDGSAAAYVSGSGTTALRFRRTAGSGDETTGLTYASADALDANGATIRDTFGSDADLTLPAPAPTGIAIDAVAPRVTAIERRDPTPASGPAVAWTVRFSEVVTGFDAGDLVVTSTGAVATGTPTVDAVDTRTAIVTVPATGEGTVRLDLPARPAAQISDAAGNPLVEGRIGEAYVLVLPPPPPPAPVPQSPAVVAQSDPCPSGTGAGVVCRPLPGGGLLILGTPGPDRLVGSPGADTIAGGAGDDVISGGGGDDVLGGGEGNDLVGGNAGDDTIYGDAGDDRLRGDAGDDTVRGGSGDDRITGDEGEDRLFGGDGADDLQGGDGNDRVSGQAGDDRVSGQAGDDDVFGGADDDRLFGSGGRDHLSGGSGDDLLRPGDDALADRLRCGTGADTIAPRIPDRVDASCGDARVR